MALEEKLKDLIVGKDRLGQLQREENCPANSETMNEREQKGCFAHSNGSRNP